MTQHATSFQSEQQLPAETAQQILAKLDHNNEIAARVPAAPLPATQPTQPVAAKRPFRRILMTTAAAVLLAGAVWGGDYYWTVGRFLVSTDDAYVKADNTTIAPKVSG